MRRTVLFLFVAALLLPPDRPSTAFATTGLILLLATDTTGYPVDSSVAFTVAVDNPGDAPVSLTFPSAQVFDIVVLDEQREVWRWSANRDFAAVETERTFAPGLTLLARPSWNTHASNGDRLPAGHYQAVGSLSTAPRQQGNTLLLRLLEPTD